MHFDAIIIGGSYAGMSAALQLLRARQRVLILDEGLRRNRFASESHGFLSQDGVDPGVIAAQARNQLMEYPTLEWKSARVTHTQGRKNAFEVSTDDGHRFVGRRLVLATGVSDVLPPLPGLAERWGKSVFHCPYCHGYELNEGRIGVLASGAPSMHQALMLPDWGATQFFLNQVFEPDAEQRAALLKRNVQIVSGAVAYVSGDRPTLHMEDGSSHPLDGLFVMAQTRLPAFVAQLGCELEQGPSGLFVKTDDIQATSVDGIFACGDMARAAASVSLAVGDGAMAGAAAHRSIMLG